MPIISPPLRRRNPGKKSQQIRIALFVSDTLRTNFERFAENKTARTIPGRLPYHQAYYAGYSETPDIFS